MTLIGVCLAALGLYVIRGFDGQLSRDLGLYSYGGQLFADGILPYVGVFERGGPLSQLLPGVGVAFANVLGFDDVLAIRWVFLVLAVVSIGLAYLVGRDIAGSRRVGLVVASTVLAFEAFTQFAANGPRDKTALVAFMLAAILGLVHQKWLVVGVFVSLATLTWQPAFIILSAGVLATVTLGVSRTSKAQAVGKVVIGGAVPLVLLTGIYAVVGEIGAFLDGFFLVNLSYTRGTPFMVAASTNFERLQSGYGISLLLMIFGLLAVIGLSAKQYVEGRSNPKPMAAALMGVGVMSLVAVAWTVWVDYDDIPDAFVLLPGAAIGLGLLSSNLKSGVVGQRVSAGLIASTLTIAVVYSVTTPASGLIEQRTSVNAILEAIPGNETILSVEAPQALVLAHSRNPTRFQLFAYGAVDYVNDVWPGGIEGYAEWIGDTAPTIIAMGRDTPPTWLAATLEESYANVGSAPGWHWYVHRALGETTIDSVRRALSQSG